MDLWIRSQNKEVLTKVNDLVVEDYADDEYIIKNYPFSNTFNGLGIYKTKERALEVLDEIQEYKDKLEKSIFLGMEESKFVSSTFIMPKE